MAKPMLDMPTPTKAAAFIAEMNEIWGDDPNNLYEVFHDASETVYCFEGTKMYAQKLSVTGEYGYVYLFADGSKVWVAINGNGCYEIGTIPPGPRQHDKGMERKWP